MTRSFPHCDSDVLHAPGLCKYCDDAADLQEERIRYHINFTGEHDPAKDLCPSERRRPLYTINRWGGNTPKPDFVSKARLSGVYSEGESQWPYENTQVGVAVIFPSKKVAIEFANGNVELYENVNDFWEAHRDMYIEVQNRAVIPHA